MDHAAKFAAHVTSASEGAVTDKDLKLQLCCFDLCETDPCDSQQGMKSRIHLPTLILALFVAGNLETKACSCLEPPPVSQALQQSSAVFLGKVKEFKPVTIQYSIQGKLHPLTFRQATFEVVRSWKGITNQTAIVYTSENGAMCGYHFVEGKSYLIYAHQETWTLPSSTTNVLFTSICSRTEESAKAQSDLESLDAKPAESKK